ncbi:MULTISPECIES: hypothetical protein [Pantoea]|uniref:hypothetical protein n=1 Tax=Pantoea TaxID=53335 RepID=UPI00257CD387|nr:hypothetical protein [Pantoea sp. UBA5960]
MTAFRVGIILSFIYILVLSLAIYLLKLNLMTSWNELGDFLAGAFSPLAFLWLILGYMQQQKELQQNTEALRIQAKELENSVVQYKEMVEVARQQLLSDRESLEYSYSIAEKENMPDISLIRTGFSMKLGQNFTFAWGLSNDGKEARNVIFKCTPAFGKLENFEMKRLGRGDISLPPVNMNCADLPSEFDVSITYESIYGRTYRKDVKLLKNSDNNYVALDDE